MGLERRLRIMNMNQDANGANPLQIRVAFASSDMKRIDQHFGAAEAFVVYHIDAQDHRILEVIQFARLEMDGNEDKLAAKIAALAGCDLVYCEAVGASAVSQLRAQGIQPIKVAPGSSVSRIIRDLRGELQDGPTGWLARAIANRTPGCDRRFDLMEAEGWSE
ncbi:nitrogen fixation protein NifX [Thiocapsa imhoffii]|uniref:Nitrogen fixation protein NifX n=2 Tax=Thiocapsa imhoffii TaxID=382777 RepID=A0A9X0WG67_9GAMM|nr:nitrogen fixation protein NifX [Thiocapsa imhoffii]